MINKQIQSNEVSFQKIQFKVRLIVLRTCLNSFDDFSHFFPCFLLLKNWRVEERIHADHEVISLEKDFQKLFSGNQNQENVREIELHANGNSQVLLLNQKAVNQSKNAYLSANIMSPENLQKSLNIIIENNQAKPKNFVPYSNSDDVWHRGCLSILTQIRQAILIFFNYSETFKFRQMTQRDFDLIDDPTTDYQSLFIDGKFNQKPNFFQKFIYKSQGYLNKVAREIRNHSRKQSDEVFVIKPDSYQLLVWNIILTCILLIHFFYETFLIVFGSQFHTYVTEQLDQNLKIISICVFVAEIVQNFLKSHYENGKLLQNRYQIVTYYLKNEFAADFTILSSEISTYFENSNASMVIQVLGALIQINQIYSIMSVLQEQIQLNNQKEAMFTLFQLFLKIVFTAHICGCSFIYITHYEIQQQTWMYKIGIYDEVWFVKYVENLQIFPLLKFLFFFQATSLYWATITMITLGYGDIVPVSLGERVFVIFVSFFACGMFAYSFNSIGSIFNTLNEKGRTLKKKLNQINSHLVKRKISHNTQMKLAQFFEYSISQELENEEDFQNKMKHLPSELYQQYTQEIYGKLLFSTKLFYLNFSKRLLLKFASKIKETTFPPGKLILERGVLNSRFYFVLQGQLDVFYQINQHCKQIIGLKELKQGDFFGQQSFFTTSAQYYNTKTKGIVTLAYLEYDDFLYSLRQFPYQYQKFCEKRDNFIFRGNQGFDLVCDICKGFRHTPENCPKLSYRPNQQKVINRFLEGGTLQKRVKQFSRHGNGRRKNPLKFLPLLQRDAIEVLRDLNYYNDPELLHIKIELIQNPKLGYFDLESIGLHELTKSNKIPHLLGTERSSQHQLSQIGPSTVQQNYYQSNFEQKQNVLSPSKQLESNIVYLQESKENHQQQIIENIQPDLNYEDNNESQFLGNTINGRNVSNDEFSENFEGISNFNHNETAIQQIQKHQMGQLNIPQQMLLKLQNLDQNFTIKDSQFDTEYLHTFDFYKPFYNFNKISQMANRSIINKRRKNVILNERDLAQIEKPRLSKDEILKLVGKLNFINKGSAPHPKQ